jgi:hypothetical protein
MKKLLAVLFIMTLLLCSLGAATGDKVLVKIKIAITEPILTLEGSVDEETYEAADVAFGPVSGASVTE